MAFVGLIYLLIIAFVLTVSLCFLPVQKRKSTKAVPEPIFFFFGLATQLQCSNGYRALQEAQYAFPPSGQARYPGLHVFLSLRKCFTVMIVSWGRHGWSNRLHVFHQWPYVFISLAFQVPFGRFISGGFLVYWLMSFLTMTALWVFWFGIPRPSLCSNIGKTDLFMSNKIRGLAVEALITILTPRFIPYFLMLWL